MGWDRFVVDYDGGVLELLNKNTFKLYNFMSKIDFLQTEYGMIITYLLLPLCAARVEEFVSNFVRREIWLQIDEFC